MIRSLVLAAVLGITPVGPAAAHKLKVFATVSGDAITGYAFFIGGGRARGVPWDAKDADGRIVSGETDAEGGFSLEPPQPVTSDITVTVDTREGHIASAVIAASRFGASAGPASSPPPPEGADGPEASGQDLAIVTPEASADMVEAAVQRQVAPLLERIEMMDDRLRLTDVMSGVFLIVGLAGIGLWARSRRR
jgi:nickel transport protein